MTTIPVEQRSDTHGRESDLAPHGKDGTHRSTTLELFERSESPRPELYEATFGEQEAAPAALHLALDGSIISSTSAARAMLGLQADEDCTGQHVAGLGFAPMDEDAWRAKVMARQVPVPGVARIDLDGCLPTTVSITGLVQPDRASYVVWLENQADGSSVTDIPAEALLRAIDTAANDCRIGVAINTTTARGHRRLAYMNEAGAALLGRSLNLLIGGPQFPPEAVLRVEGQSSIIAWPSAQGDRVLELGIGIEPYGGQDANVVIFSEVTDGDSNERERKRLVQELFNANVDLRNFARATTHDLRAPLRSISGFAALLERRIRGRLDDDDVRLINNVIASTKRMDQLIEALAAFAAVGAREPEIAHVELNTVLGDVLSDLASELDHLDIRLEFTSLPSVRGDPLQLRQLFQNLLGNAIKFRSEVPHRVRLESEMDSQWITVRFIDNGTGIDLEKAHDLFEPFRRFHDLAKFPGSGLGLATCKRITEAHGGAIEVSSELGVGSTFTVRLPNV